MIYKHKEIIQVGLSVVFFLLIVRIIDLAAQNAETVKKNQAYVERLSQETEILRKAVEEIKK